jgi:hypothetical protein
MSPSTARHCLLSFLAWMSGLFISVSAQTIPPDFPKGVKRTWYSFGQGPGDYTILQIDRGRQVTVTAKPGSSSSMVTTWYSLHPYDRAWLENIYLWLDQQRTPPEGSAAGSMVLAPANPNRFRIHDPVITDAISTKWNKLVVASYLWWWHDLNYLLIEDGKDREDQLEFLIEALDDTFDKDVDATIHDFAAFQASLKACFEKTYGGLAGFSVLEQALVSPEVLHQQVRGVDLAMLGVVVLNGSREYGGRVALLDVSETGKIEFIHNGNLVVGQLTLVDPSQDRRRQLGPIAWKIEILNEASLPGDYAKGATEFYLDPGKRGTLWLVRPCRYSAKEFAHQPAPTIPAPDMSIYLPKSDPQSPPPVFKRNPYFFNEYHSVSGFEAPRRQGAITRKWTDANGRSTEARFVGFGRRGLAEPAGISIDPGTGPIFLNLEQLGAPDAAFVRFLALDQVTEYGRELGAKAGTLTYYLNSPEGPVYEVKVHYGNNQCLATVRELETKDGDEEKGIVEKAREFVFGSGGYTLAVDYERFAYKTTDGAGTKRFLPEDLKSRIHHSTFVTGQPQNIVTWINRAALVEHLGLPCRVMVDLEKVQLAAPGFNGAGKVALFSRHEATFVWKMLCSDSAVPGSSLMQSFKPFADAWYAGSIIPMDVRMVHSLNPALSIRLQLVDYDFNTPAPEVTGLE